MVGLVGVGFVVNGFASALELAWSRHRGLPLAVATMFALFAHVYCTARLAGHEPGTTRVAAVNTIATFGPATPTDAASAPASSRRCSPTPRRQRAPVPGSWCGPRRRRW